MPTYFLKLINKPLHLISKLTVELAKDIDKPEWKRDAAFRRFEADCAEAEILLEKKHSCAEYFSFVLKLRNLVGNLREIFFNLKLHKITPDSTIKSAIILLEKALVEIAKDLNIRRPAGLPGRKTITHARKMIHLAKIARLADKDNFIENLKFSNIYGNLDKCFQIAEDLFEMITQIKK